MDYRERITTDPQVRFGKPCIRGTRITVFDILGYLAGGAPTDELLEDFPELSRADLLACFAYAAEAGTRLVTPHPPEVQCG